MGVVTVAVHQPNYLPWLGYFYKISKADVFVFLDNVQFERRGYCSRTRIIGTNGEELWLTQNVQKSPRDSLIQDTVFSDRFWIKKHLRTLQVAYRKAPHFEEVFRRIESLLQPDIAHLPTFNGLLIQEICRSLGIGTRLLHASRLELDTVATPSERIARIVRLLRGTVYLSGSGAKAYNDTATFANNDIELAYSDFAVFPYPQRTQEFKAGLSIIDALFHLGFDGVASFLRSSHQ